MTFRRTSYVESNPAARRGVRRRSAKYVDSVIVHRLGGPLARWRNPKHPLNVWRDNHGLIRIRTVEDALFFFTKDPEGVATVTVRPEKVMKTAIQWAKDGGVPEGIEGGVPYHDMVDVSGNAAKFLPATVKGNHAGNANPRSMGLALLDVPLEGPTLPQVSAFRRVLVDYMRTLDIGKVRGHDEVRSTPKGCPGASVMYRLAYDVAWARAMADHSIDLDVLKTA